MDSIHLYTFIKHVAILFPTFMVIFTARGFFQAAAAYLFGDTSAHEDGFLTLNPLAHIDIVGTMALAVTFASVNYFYTSGGGPSLTLLLVMLMVLVGIRPYYFVPMDASQFKYRRIGILAVTLATTLSHLLVVLASMYLLIVAFDLLGGASPIFLIIQQVTSSLTEWGLFWAVLSLIPVPPFEGGAFLPVLLGDWGQALYDALEPYGLLIFVSLFWIPGVRDVMIIAINTLHFLLYQGLMQLVFI
jgi:Zn-dependent protease